MFARLKNIKNNIVQLVTDSKTALKENTLVVWTGTIVGGLSGLCCSVYLALRGVGPTTKSENYRELIRLAMENTASKYNCDITRLPPVLDSMSLSCRQCERTKGIALPDESQRVMYNCTTLMNANRADQEARDAIAALKPALSLGESFTLIGSIFVLAPIGVIVGAFVGFYSAVALVNSKIKLFKVQVREEMMLEDLTIIIDPRERKKAIKELRKSNPHINIYSLNNTVAILAKIRKTHAFTLKQAQAWQLPELHAWLLLGINLIKTGKLTADLLLLIATFVANCSTDDIVKIHTKHLEIVPEKLYKVSLASLNDKFFKAKTIDQVAFSQQQVAAGERFTRRIKGMRIE